MRKVVNITTKEDMAYLDATIKDNEELLAQRMIKPLSNILKGHGW